MSPSMPITIPTHASSTASNSSSSAASSPSSAGVYVPVHRRTKSDVPAEPKRSLSIYTPAELMSLAQSPLAKQLSGAMHAALRDQEFSAIALSKRQQRSREYMQRKSAAAPTESTPNTVNPAPRRRPGGRVDPRRRNLNPASRFAGLDGALSWRAQMRRMDMVAPAVSLAA